VVDINSWSVRVVAVNWESRSLGNFSVVNNLLLNNWSNNLLVMMIMVVMIMMVFMMIMVITVMIMLLVVLVEEGKVRASSDFVLDGEESVGKGDEIGSVDGVNNEHILDKVISEIGISVGDKLESFLDETLADGAVLVVISIFRVQKSSKSKESLAQRVNISLGFVALDLEVAVGDLLDPFRGKESLGTLNDGEGKSVGALLSVKGGVRELVCSFLGEDVEGSDITVGVALGLEIGESADEVVSDGEELVFSVIDLSSFAAFEVFLEVVFEDFNVDRDLVIG
jgi:hypothetical protein